MYIPQEIAKDMVETYGNDTWTTIKGMFQTQMPLFKEGISKWNQDEFEKFAISNSFMHPNYKGDFSILNSKLLYDNATRIGNAKSDAELVTLMTDLRDLIMSPLLVSDWMRHKTVYKPDKDFVDMLINTSNFKLHIDQLANLPYQDLCFDFSACPDLAPVQFGFLSFRYVENYVLIANYLINKNKNMFSFYYGAKIDDGYIELSELDLRNKLPEKDEYLVTSQFSSTNSDERYDYKYNRVAISEIMLQLIGYITCQNAEVKQSQQSKKTYKNHPANYRPKNDISEFKEYEVGVRIGKTIRKQTEIDRGVKQHSDNVAIRTGSSGEKSPHIRGAHWHHYWTGKGRTELIVKWIAPTFVNKDKPAKDIVVHKIKN